MNLVNVAIENLGAKIKTYSSFIDDLHQPSNILQTSEYSLWATAEGLPQFVIVSLQDLNLKYKEITQVGFMLWHDYDTNPKTVQLWVAETTDSDFIFWGEFTLDQKKGIQLYGIRPLPERFIYLKISITETYGAFQTYLNQVFFMAAGTQAIKTQKKIKDTVIKKKKQLDLEDLQSNLKQLVQFDRRISHSKSNQKKQQKVTNRKILENESSLMQEANKRKKNEISKGSSSGNRAGFSIYYHEASHFADDESIDYASNDYESSSQKAQSRKKLSLEMIQDQKGSSQNEQSQQFLHTQQSNSMGMSPSLNLKSISESFSIKKDKLQSGLKKANKQKQSIKRNLYKQKKRKASFESDFDEREVVEQEKQSENGEMEEGQDLERKQQFSNQQVRNTPKYKEFQLTSSPGQPSSIKQRYHQQSSSHHQQPYFNTVISAISTQVGKLEDNMEAIQRKVQVMDMKLAHSHKKMNHEMLEKMEKRVEQIVDRKLNKIWSVNLLKSSKENKYNENLQGKDKQITSNKEHKRTQNKTYTDEINYKKNLTKEFFKNDYQDQQQKFTHLKDKTKTKRRDKEEFKQDRKEVDNFQENYGPKLDDRNMNRLKTSKSYAHIARQENKFRRQQVEITRNQEKKGPNQEYIAKLLQRLNRKLKQRQTKLSKIQKKEKENLHKDNQQLETSMKVGRNQKRRVVTNNYGY